MLNSLFGKGMSTIDIAFLLLSIPAVVFSLSFHEAAHGYTAGKMGDQTARFHGRVTLNPLKHLDPIGALSMLFFGIGWAKPVPVNPRNFKNPKKGMALTGLAGPVSNLILAFGSLLIYRIIAAIVPLSVFFEKGLLYYRPGAFSVIDFVAMFFMNMASLNIGLAVFNLIPVPPFDGSRVFYFLLPDRYYFGVMRYERTIMVVTMVLLLVGVLDVPLAFVRQILIRLFEFIIGLVPFL